MPEEKRPLSAADLYKLQLVGNPQMSPDGKHNYLYRQSR